MMMLWAACCLGFFAFLRAGEFTLPSDTEFDEEVHLTWNDVSIDDPGSPSFLRVHIKQSKTDRSVKGRISMWVEQELSCALWQPFWITCASEDREEAPCFDSRMVGLSLVPAW